ncbi:class I SAM-dependent methyltransferase [Umezawaea sp.]|uniref:class I SAM-dependent methyltransferase n=1 Tax=Umezawaea sp. TaxID=1955258 RepID=UPI002ED46343
MSGGPVDVRAGADEYDASTGRWSGLLAPRFVGWLPTGDGLAWCDVGCGTGALARAVLAGARPTWILGVDPSETFVAAAVRDGVDAVVGTATAIPAGDAEFDRVVSGLVLNVVPRPEDALAEMRRVARPGGVVGAYVWDYAEGTGVFRLFWDAALAVDPAAADLDERVRFPVCRPDPLRALFEGAGLTGVVVEPLDLPVEFGSFDDLWLPFLSGEGAAPRYLATLTGEHRSAVAAQFRRTVPHAPDGSISLAARAWTVRGVV